MKKAAHFLLLPYLQTSPPNDALVRAYRAMNVEVEFYSPDIESADATMMSAPLLPVQYGIKWCLRNVFSKRWFEYDYFSCTSEDPIAIAGLLAFIYRKPLIFLSDEIKSGSYRGDRSEYWKKICRWAMRRAQLTIVNDESRIALQKSYAHMTDKQEIIVYPGCFLEPPQALVRRTEPRSEQVILAFSGGFNMTGGVQWALQALNDYDYLSMIIQPLGIDSLTRLLLLQHRDSDRIKLSDKRLSWQQAWQSMGEVDIGVAIYHNDSPQFQKMGISSNRLCMFIAMGVPVIVSRQPSFQFVEDYNCGYMVDSQEQFNQAVQDISNNLQQMKQNALRCAQEYINTAARHQQLLEKMQRLEHS